MSEKIAFVGVGRMGGNMALRLLDAGYRLGAVYDVRAESAGCDGDSESTEDLSNQSRTNSCPAGLQIEALGGYGKPIQPLLNDPG